MKKIVKIALLGATGSVGSRILTEALSRGYDVTAISRHADTLASRPGLATAVVDVNNEDALSMALLGHDVVLSAVRFRDFDITRLLSALKRASVLRLLMVGGAGTLRVASGQELADTENFPEAAKPEALAGKAVLDKLRAEQEIDWTFLSPSAVFSPGERTGAYRTGKDDLLIGPDGKSRLSQEDFAIAMLDELENAQHSRQRITIGY